VCVCVHLISGRSLASGLNEDYDAGCSDLRPPVIWSVADSNSLPRHAADIPSYAGPNLSMDTRPGSRELAALTAEFYIPLPSVLNASGYAGSHGSLPEVVADAPDVLRKVGMGSQARIHAFKHLCPYNTIQNL